MSKIWNRLRRLNATIADGSRDPERWWWGLSFAVAAFALTTAAIFDERFHIFAYLTWILASGQMFWAGYNKRRLDERRGD